MAQFITPFDPSALPSSTFDAPLPNGGWIFIHNESPIELAFTVGTMTTPVLVPAFVARCFQVRQPVRYAKWQNVGNVSGGGQAPISLVYGELYEPDEWGGSEVYVALTRLTNVGNQAGGGTLGNIVNDGNAPGTSIIEATPNDQASSSVQRYNDASGFERVLSANVLRDIRRVVRGNAGVGKAAITFGDSGDTSITTFYGTVGSGSVVPGSTVSGAVASATTASSANSVAAANVGAGNLGAGVKQQNGATVAGLDSAGGGAAGTQIWVGTTDPGGSAAEGDIWIKS